MDKGDWKKRLGVVYSTNPDFEYVTQTREEAETLPPDRQRLTVRFERSGRSGKQVTLVQGFVGRAEALSALARTLKTRCGAGGSAKDGEIVMQGDLREKLVPLLSSLGYKAKRAN